METLNFHLLTSPALGEEDIVTNLARSASMTAAALSFTAAILTTTSALAHDPDPHGQAPPIAPFGELVPRHLDSGELANKRPAAATVFSSVIATPDAIWTRLYFADITLEGTSRIRFTSLLDGEVQELNSAGAAMWGNTSAYFNGPMVQIELIAAPGTTQNRFVLEQLGVDFHVFAASNHCTPPLQCGLCDGDTRVPSNENWACRLVSASGGCSAAIYNPQSCVVSAGHCMGSNMVIQFNVPQSNPDCSINHPPTQDQFPITSQISQNGGVGADWAVMTSGTNNLGQTAFDRFGEYRPIAASVPNSGPADVWGYGVTDNCVLRQTQQHSTGIIFSLTSTAVRHSADTTCGNSGSSLLSNGEIIGIVSHCSWTCPPDGNTATRIDVPAFVAARANICSIPEDVTVPGDYATIQAAIDAVGSGSTITVAPGTYNEAINFNGKNLTVISSSGPEVTFINATGQNASVVRFSNNETSAAVLEGFHLTGGTGSSVNLGGTNYVLGGGIYASGGATPTINNGFISGNTAQFGGGVFNNNASPTFNNCKINSNSASPSSGGGAFNFSGAAPTFNNVEINSNTAGASGGGMSNQSANPIVNNCVFLANSANADGGAVRNIQDSAGQFINSHFGGNTAGGTGGAFFNDASGGTLIADSVFCENDPNDITGNHNDGGGNLFLTGCPNPCGELGDVNCDGVVDVSDLLILLGAWGTCGDPNNCPADLDGNGEVDVSDLLILLGNWG